MKTKEHLTPVQKKFYEIVLDAVSEDKELIKFFCTPRSGKTFILNLIENSMPIALSIMNDKEWHPASKRPMAHHALTFKYQDGTFHTGFYCNGFHKKVNGTITHWQYKD